MHLFKKFKCEKCDKKFKQQEELMQHEQVIHGKDLQYDCKECNQFFSSMEQMRTHLQRYHSYRGTRDI
ncbi:MAG: hypothetical protein HZA82_00230 [Thaumarchaeota archaeon]|jgi:uncharacterized C2H2 Zn-finger protein|nr:hypothetical protein [Nitrososphaerota archaeon]